LWGTAVNLESPGLNFIIKLLGNRDHRPRLHVPITQSTVLGTNQISERHSNT
jgi:hypothetical protein